MASFHYYFLLSLLISSILLINHIAICEDDEENNNVADEEDNLLQGINTYRTSLKLSSLTENEIAECLADEMADQFKAQPCTAANTVTATKPQFQNYPMLLAKCGLNVSNTMDGVILPTCVPNLVPNVVLSSYTTMSQNSEYLNNGKFTGIGIGNEDNWTVVVLTTSTPGVGVGVGGGGGAGGRGGESFGDADDNDDEDEEDQLHQGINNFRASFNLSALTENDKAECLADEIADQFQDQPCTADSTRSYAAPGSEPQFANYRRLLAECNVNVATTRDGIILPVCVPDLIPALVLSNYTQSRYSQYIKDTKFTGIGIGTENNWTVLVLTTNTPGGSFIASQNVGNASLAAKLDSIYHLAFLIIGFLVMLL